MKQELNAMQKIAARSYGGGDYADFAEKDWPTVRGLLETCGDPLFKFIMIELSDQEDCDGLATAIQRLALIEREICEVRNAIEEAIL